MTKIPAKSDYVVPVSLTVVQKQLYKAVLTRNYEFLRKNARKGSAVKVCT